jgi:3-deoxy-7-phosphoheptulonate synthase
MRHRGCHSCDFGGQALLFRKCVNQTEFLIKVQLLSTNALLLPFALLTLTIHMASLNIPQLSNAGKTAADLKTNGSSAEALTQPHNQLQAWTLSSWTTKPIKQDAVYPDRMAVEKSLTKLEHLPPIVTPTEIVKLKASLRDVALGKAFLLQGGDCAELFDYCEENAIESKIKLLLQMSLVLIWGSNKPVVRIARMAGQYAKPRSSPTEMVNGKETPSFRGDILNGYDLEERALDPGRLVR